MEENKQDMYRVVLEKVQKSKKEHKCSKCEAIIPVGSEYIRSRITLHRYLVRCTNCGLRSWEVKHHCLISVIL